MSKNEESLSHRYRVPVEVIQAWERGDYFTGGVPSVAYKHLGIALRLRGLYTYAKAGDSGQDFKGLAKIDLAGGRELVMDGFRLWGEEKEPEIRFWRTEFSHFLTDDTIIWTYQLFDCDSTGQLSKHLSNKTLPHNPKPKSHNFGFKAADWIEVQQFLLGKEFARELTIAEGKCNDEATIKIMLHFKLQTNGDILAQYRQLRSIGEDIAGDSLFKRIDP